MMVPCVGKEGRERVVYTRFPVLFRTVSLDIDMYMQDIRVKTNYEGAIDVEYQHFEL